jgi:alpha-glucosidase
MPNLLKILFTALLLLGAAQADAKETIISPDGRLTLVVGVGDDGAFYSVKLGNELVIAPSKLGFILKSGKNFSSGFRLESAQTSDFDQTWEQPWGERQFVRNNYRELMVTLAGGADSLKIQFRLYDDGLGYRYLFPDSLVGDEITSELTEFNFAESGTAWWIEARLSNRYEYLYKETPITAVSMAHTPITFKLASGTHVSLHEAALLDYSGMSIRRIEDASGERKFTADLAPNAKGSKVTLGKGHKSSWRTIQISPDAKGLISSNLILNLNEPNRLGDVSWIKPGKYVGIWWGMHLGVNTWGSGPKHGATTSEVKRYIDFAAKYGFNGVLVEGWNIGWDGDWFNNGAIFKFTEAYPDFDIAELTRYSKEKGVPIIGHHETSGNVGNYESQMDAAFDLYEKMGVATVKTGYVADAGDIDRLLEDGTPVKEFHDGQFMSNHHERVLVAAAKRKISINSHEPIKGTGLRRTYPNWLSREGARGMEYSAWGTPGNPPSHTVILPFTRMLSGPMDFTPGIFDLEIADLQPGNRVESTIAKQLAYYVVLYSPIQMAADLPKNYEANLAPFQFIRDVPTDWSESIALTAEIGEQVTFARKDRASDDWYIGSITGDKARTMQLPLNFLDKGVRYKAEIYVDGEGADWKTNPYAIEITSRTVTASDTLTLNLASGGGGAVRLTPIS